MEFNELEELIANHKIGPTLNQISTKLGLLKKEDRPKGTDERDWVHSLYNARQKVYSKMRRLNQEREKFSENNLFSEIKKIDSRRYNEYLDSILKNYNNFGVSF